MAQFSFVDTKVGCMKMALGNAEVLLIWRPRLLVGKSRVRPDALVHYKSREKDCFLLLEIDENGEPSAKSLRRERLLSLPCLRITDRELTGATFVQTLLDMVADAVGHSDSQAYEPKPSRWWLQQASERRWLCAN